MSKSPEPTSNADTGMAWHYTTFEKWGKIIECNELRPYLCGAEKELRTMLGFRPLLWFTTNQFFEPSIAPKGFIVADDDGTPIRAPCIDPGLVSTAVIDAGGWGWVRFGYQADRLLTEDQAYMITRPLAALISDDPSKVKDFWRVSLKPIRLLDIEAIDVMCDKDSGVSVPLEWRRVWTNEEPRQRQHPLDPFPTFAWM